MTEINEFCRHNYVCKLVRNSEQTIAQRHGGVLIVKVIGISFKFQQFDYIVRKYISNNIDEYGCVVIKMNYTI